MYKRLKLIRFNKSARLKLNNFFFTFFFISINSIEFDFTIKVFSIRDNKLRLSFVIRGELRASIYYYRN